MIRRLAIGAFFVWLGRWVALEVANRIAGRRQRPEVSPKDSPWPPGRMPGPWD